MAKPVEILPDVLPFDFSSRLLVVKAQGPKPVKPATRGRFQPSDNHSQQQSGVIDERHHRSAGSRRLKGQSEREQPRGTVLMAPSEDAALHRQLGELVAGMRSLQGIGALGATGIAAMALGVSFAKAIRRLLS